MRARTVSALLLTALAMVACSRMPAGGAPDEQPVPDTQPPSMISMVASPAVGVHPYITPRRVDLTLVARDSESPTLSVDVVVRRDGAAAEVRRLHVAADSGTTVTVSWDLKFASGSTALAGAYRIDAWATDAAGNRSATGTVPARILSLAQVAARASGTRAKGHALVITDLGIRKAGGSAERRAASYVAAQFREYGYADVRRPAVPLKDGTTSLNVVAVRKGATPRSPIIIIGAHIDSRADRRSPGGNDNASGVGVLLETARVMAAIPTNAELWFVAFGAEEIYDGNPDHHHEGSRALARRLTRDQLARGVRMVNLDMVGVGSRMQVGTQRGAFSGFARYHLATADALGYQARYAWHGSGSDHEPFVKLGIPVAYYDRATDPAYHTPRDTAERLSATALGQAARTLVATLVRHTAR